MWCLSADLLVYAPAAEDRAVVYQIASGDTHLVTALAAQIIQFLQSTRAATPSSVLKQQILDASLDADPAKCLPLFDATLAELCRLDLITDTAA